MTPTLFWTALFVITTFGLYIGIAVWARAGTTNDFYVAGHDVHPVFNGMATAADWMSAASFLSMAGLIAFMGYDGSVYLMGWTGGYVLLALLLAPYLRKFGKFTVPDFIGDRYYSNVARVVAVICALFISFTYIAGQMRGVGIAFSNFLQVPIEAGVVIGAIIVLFYAVLGGMKGITYTQVAQYCVLIFAYTVPAIFLSLQITGTPLPQLGLIGSTSEGVPLLQSLDNTLVDLGFQPYTEGQKSKLDMFAITLALMVGTAGLPHVIIRFFTVPKASDARKSAGWALVFIALLYTTAPAVAVFARSNFIETVNESVYQPDVAAEERVADATPQWFHNWEVTGLLGVEDKNGDGRVQYRADPEANEVTTLNRDIFVLANPEIGGLPAWVIGLVVAGGLAAALSTAAGLLMVISSAVSHDLCRKVLFKDMSDTQELLVARMAAVGAVLVAIYAGINPPGFVAAVVAFAFGLAAASFFPAIFLGIFWKRMNQTGAIAGMITGLLLTGAYIIHFKIGFSSTVLGVCALLLSLCCLIVWFGARDGIRGVSRPEGVALGGMGALALVGAAGLAGFLPDIAVGQEAQWFLGVSPEGFGSIGMVVAFAVSILASLATAAPPREVQEMVEEIRLPSAKAHVSHQPAE